MKVRFCEHNKHKGKVFRRLSEEFPELDMKIKKCIKQCSSCRDNPMATVDKQKITANDGELLFEKIRMLIQKENGKL